ncbi:alcohol dehydrogenase catalytic domain-containing protein [Streptomyces sp. NPDC059851]|uniref:alcohol dehydrogenase catalytic domain-containing protein n=1 Tax=Streptomyces sp. NPDC059851 TaxID=3346971 RepID=UPI00365B4834
MSASPEFAGPGAGRAGPVHLGPSSAELQDRPVAQRVSRDDVVVEVVGRGVCGTDRKILLGRFPARQGGALGHEAAGVVRETGLQVRSGRAAGARRLAGTRTSTSPSAPGSATAR